MLQQTGLDTALPPVQRNVTCSFSMLLGAVQVGPDTMSHACALHIRRLWRITAMLILVHLLCLCIPPFSNACVAQASHAAHDEQP